MDKEYITLNTFIKIKFLIPTGGQAKVIIRSGAVKVNGIAETRNKKKLVDNDIIEYNGNKFTVSLKDW
ncbi:MAG: RNA-binding S4 domain-containing protein [Nanoarchaeota archaeon]|nr:RNA-binding S4 domain-containing protein [Nanoarchaeota archaeon]MBU1004379.1 RNA-binding S4 domain-containing protein [Nanoarchaeota archaeon]MBU1946734.1 RNA-binding S4 domain-containing protein [Nanoarchaeota archaeon]